MIQSIFLVTALWAAVSVGAAGQASSANDSGNSARQGARGAPESSVRIESLPARAVLLRTVRGGFEQHEAVFREFMAYAEANYRTIGRCFGVYPMDPDAVKRGELTWQVGVEVGSGSPGHVEIANRSRSPRDVVVRLTRPRVGYELAVMPSVEAAVLPSTVARSPVDGLAMVRWLAESGYVQTGATRMEYMSHDGPPLAIATRIIVPVVKRARGIRLAPKSP